MARPAREPTIIRRPNINHLHQRTKKRPIKGVRVLVEMVRVELTSYAAAKQLSTYLVCLLFLSLVPRANTLCKTQKAKYSYMRTFRHLRECSV